MYQYLKNKLADKNVAALCVYYSCTVAIVFVVWVMLCVGLGGCFQGYVRTIIRISASLLVVMFLVWLWIGFVAAARSWPEPRFGLTYFKVLQFMCLLMCVIIFIQVGDWQEIGIFQVALLICDVFIMSAALLFLPLCWLAKFRVPRSVYLDLGVIIALFVVQVFLLVR